MADAPARAATATAEGRGRRRVMEWGPVLLWAGLIFWFSAQPNLRVAQDNGLDFIVRKAGHMFVFGVLAALCLRALADAPVRVAPLLAWLLATGYAVTDELHQSFTDGRHASPVDVGIDAAGALIGLGFSVAARLLIVRMRSRVRPTTASAD